MKFYRIVISIFLVLIFPGIVFASKTSRVIPKQTIGHVTTLHEEADRLDYDDVAKVLRLYGHVKLFQGETSLFADTVIYDFKSSQVRAEGNLKFLRKEDRLTGERLHLYYREKHVEASGNPVNYVSESISLGKLPVMITAHELDYRWEERVIRGNGNTSLEQKGVKAFADQMVYEGKKGLLTLDGHVHLVRSAKDSLWCDHLVYFLQTNQSQAEGHVRAELILTEKP